jgi:SAM-dependent methyltransferase
LLAIGPIEGTLKRVTGRLRPPHEFCLPPGYAQQAAAWTHDAQQPEDPARQYWSPRRIAASRAFGFHVYTWAASLIARRGLRSVLDVGCGPGVKLATLIAPVCGDLEGIDQASGVLAATALGSPGRYTVVDLEDPSGVTPWRQFDLIICADALEHLLDPDPALAWLKGFCHDRSLIVLSTPCRARVRGRACLASTKREHVREWTREEFIRFVTSRGFEVLESRLFPEDDAPLWRGLVREWLFRMGVAGLSPHHCHAVLCRPASGA